MTPIVCAFAGLPPRARLRAYVARARRWPTGVPFLVAALFPVVLERVSNLLAPEPGWLGPAIGAGIAAGLASFGLGAVLTVLRRVPAFSVAFGEAVEVRVGSRTTVHPWSWVRGAHATATSLVLHCGEPLRSLRLGGPAMEQDLHLPAGEPSTEALRALLARRGIPIASG